MSKARDLSRVVSPDHADGRLRKKVLVRSAVLAPRRPSVARIVSAALFGAILIAFALPFGAVSCEGPPVHFTGYELATWRVPETSPPATTDDGDKLKDEIESQASIWALIALVAAVAGLAVGLLERRGAGIAASVGLFAIVTLFATAFNTMATVEFEEGYVSAAALFGLAASWQAVMAIRRVRARRRAPPAKRSPASGAPGVSGV